MAKKPTIHDMRELAQERGGQCLSRYYMTATTKLRWRCAKGHEWRAVPHNVRHGTWCPECGRSKIGDTHRKYTIGDMRALAKQRDGKCLSRIYLNNRTKLRWQCANGHKWEALPQHIKHGSWCPACTNRCKYTIGNMQEWAAQRGGKCLSDTYKGIATKLRWQCINGHEWEAIPTNIRKGSWCPVCARKKRRSLP